MARSGVRTIGPEAAAAQPEGEIVEPIFRLSPTSNRERNEAHFRIFIVDAGGNPEAHRVLHDNFCLIRDLQKEDPIYVLSTGQSIEFMRRHGARVGWDPIIAVHDLAAMDGNGTSGFHGFRLHLGLLHTPQQILAALQNFVLLLSTHRRSSDLSAGIRAGVGKGSAGAIAIDMPPDEHEIGG